MPYRADVEAQRLKCDILEKELADARLKASALADAQRRVASKQREVADARRLLAELGDRRCLPLLDSLRVASPCNASWEDMVGDERVRFCGQCAKNVYNLSAMTREEAETVVREKNGDLCVRMYERTDGTVMTTDCPVGARRKRRRRAAVAVASSGMMAAGLLSIVPKLGTTCPTQGAVVTIGGTATMEPSVPTEAPHDQGVPQAAPPLPEPARATPAAPHVMGHVMGRMSVRSK